MDERSPSGPVGAPALRPTLACIDMAGTTMRDEGIVLKAFSAALHAVGTEGEAFEQALQYAHETMGLPKTAVFRELLGQEVLVDKAMAAFDASVLELVGQGAVSEIEGAVATFEALRAAGLKIALTTGFSSQVQEAVIDGLGWRALVDLVIAPGPGLRGRPFPDMVLHAALQAQVDDVRQVVVVGDTANDLWSGHRAGAGVVAGVLTGSHSQAELAQAPHTHILASINDLVPILVSLSY
jgi:phosphonatase-like hydrolase